MLYVSCPEITTTKADDCLQLLNLDLKSQYKDGINQLGFSLEDLLEEERDAALGNGGLGRLAACYLDSSASQDLPVWGYGMAITFAGVEPLLMSLYVRFTIQIWYFPAVDIARGQPTRSA